MAAKLQAFGRGGAQSGELSVHRARIIRCAEQHVDEAFATILGLMRTAKRETVRFDAAITVLELSQAGGEGMEPDAAPPTKIVIVTGEAANEELARRRAINATPKKPKPKKLT